VGVDRHGAGTGVGDLVGVPQASARPADHDLEAVLGQPLDHALAPLDDGDGVLQGAVEVERVDLGEGLETVGVDVDEGGPLPQARVGAGDDEGGRGDLAAHAEPGADALGEGGLPGAEVPGEDDEVAGAQDAGEAAPELAGGLGVGGLPGGHEGSSCETWVRGMRLPSRVTIS